MTIAHVHLLLNHFPTIGTLIGLGLLVGSLISKNQHERRAGLGVVAAMAILAFPVFFSGRSAAETLKDIPGVSSALITQHYDAAIPAFIAMQVLGALAWVGLFQWRRHARIPAATFGAVLATGAVTLLLMVQTATSGGDIRHPEIIVSPDVTTQGTPAADPPVLTVSWLRSDAISHFVQNTSGVWPFCEIVHYLGLSLLVGVVLIVNLRLLGLLKSMPFASMSALLPWALVGFGLNTFTGLVFFIGEPKHYITNPAYAWKIAFLTIAGLSGLYMTIFADEAWALKSGERAPFALRAVAVCVMISWAGVLYYGRMLPYLGNSF